MEIIIQHYLHVSFLLNKNTFSLFQIYYEKLIQMHVLLDIMQEFKDLLYDTIILTTLLKM